MNVTAFRNITALLGLLLYCLTAAAQPAAFPELEISNGSGEDRKNIHDYLATITNTTGSAFKGYIRIKTPDNLKCLLGNLYPIEIPQDGKNFLSLKLMVAGGAVAGDAVTEVLLLDEHKNTLLHKTITINIPEKSSLRLHTHSPFTYINNPDDSLSIQVNVSNEGNTQQQVTLVFHIPELSGGNTFFELKGVVPVQKDTTFSFRFLPTRALLSRQQFSVRVSGLSGAEKILFGNVTITVQNVSSKQRYHHTEHNNFNYLNNNGSITASYRSIGNSGSMSQLLGSGSLDLPAGYLSLNGNIYKNSGQQDYIANNTYLSYHLHNSEIKIGNINQPMELSLYGRGAEISLRDKERKSELQAGFVDQHFNLLSPDPLFRYGQGLYLKGTLNAQNPGNSFTSTYIHKADVFEQATHQLLGTDKGFRFNEHWNMRVKLHGALSTYSQAAIVKPTFAFESLYSGRTQKGTNLAGNYFYSSNYFPGNRRGVLLLQQSVNTPLPKNHTGFANIFISNFAPKSYTYNTNTVSNNLRSEAGISLPSSRAVRTTLSYQYQREAANSYNSLFENPYATELLRMEAHRLSGVFSTYSRDKKHAYIFSIEGGIVQYPGKPGYKGQLKLNASYQYKYIHFNSSYQQGSFFLSEYAGTQRNAGDVSYQRLLLLLAYNHSFFAQKLSVNSGVSFIKDHIMGATPSAFLNARYSASPRYLLFVNAAGYQYNINAISPRSHSRAILTVEAGLTYNFKARSISRGKKGKVRAFVYYDRNTNNVFDEGDERATEYLVQLNNNSFKTNAEGNFLYTKVPFATYKYKADAQQGWFANEEEFKVRKYRSYLEIPLHQNGTLSGTIQYVFDTKKALPIDPKTGGVTFNIYHKDQLIQKVATNEDGQFLCFLPTGTYTITLNTSSLPAVAYCEAPSRIITIESGKINPLEPFFIKVREKKINVKRFGE